MCVPIVTGTLWVFGKIRPLVAALSIPSVYTTSARALMYALRYWETLAIATWRLAPVYLRIKVLVCPAETVRPAVVAPKMKLLVHVPESVQTADDTFPVPRLVPGLSASTSVIPSRKLGDDAARPLKVMVTLLSVAAPAESAVKANLPSSGVPPRFKVDPVAVAVKASFVRKTVFDGPAGAFEAVGAPKEIAEVAFEVLPVATIVSIAVSLTVSVEVAILKTCVALSLAPDEAYEFTSPFKANTIEPP